ncbi:MAG TPA: type II toxin-antitoxin system RelE/ParE family toxin [Kiloniellaceae bacterium]|nr:type II toxin-antitoxin system RelE/ParE family toxin [Kiloniellaceae bacterium]
MVARNPECGVLLADGLRKVRFALDGRGKSGGVRVIYYFYNEEIPIFLLEVFAKNQKDNLTKAELTKLAQAAKAIPKAYRGSA